MKIVLRVFLVLAFVVALAAAAGYAWLRRSLPQLDGALTPSGPKAASANRARPPDAATGNLTRRPRRRMPRGRVNRVRAVRYKHHVVFAVPSRITQTLIFFHL